MADEKEHKGAGEKVKQAFKNKAPIKVKLKFNSQVPVMKFEKHKKGYIQWGEKNLLPDSLIELGQEKSSTHASILQRKTRMIAGNGWEEPQTQEAREFLANIKGSHDLNDAVLLNASENEFLNHWALRIRWNIDKTRIGAIDFISAGKCRLDEDESIIWFSNDWSQPKKKDNKPVKMQAFNRKPLPADFDELSEEDQKLYLNQILFIKELQIGTDSYARPTYAAGMNWILADAAISTFTLNMIKKNFAGGFHINIATGIPDDDERREFKEDFIDEYGGEDGDSIIITFSDGEEEAPQFNQLPSTGNEDIYADTDSRVTAKIFTVHEVTNAALFAIKTPGELGGTSKDEMIESLEIQQSVYIDQRQEGIEKVYNKLAKINGVTEELKLKRYTLGEIKTEQDGNDTETN